MNGLTGTLTQGADNWKGIGSTGLFSITVNGTALTDLNPDFSGVASMADVATAIQTVLDAGLTGTTCAWSVDHFVITAPGVGNGTITVLSAPGSGVDIAAAGWMNGKTGTPTDEVLNWKGFAARGKFSMTVNGTALTDMNPDFSAVASMTDVATAIQAVLDSGVYELTIPFVKRENAGEGA